MRVFKNIILRVGILVFFLAVIDVQAFSQSNRHSRKAVKAFSKAETAYFDKHFDVVERQLRKALEIEPDYLEARLLLAETKMETEKKDEALDLYESIFAYDSSFYPPAAITLARLYNDFERYSDAVDILGWYLDRSTAKGPLKATAEELMALSVFRSEAVENPVPFEPKNLGPAINTDNDEYVNVLQMDGNMIMITRRFVNQVNRVTDAYKENLMISNRGAEGEWQTAEPFELKWRLTENMGAAVISADGKELYFSACGWSTGYGSCDLYVSYNHNGEWLEPVNLGKHINTSSWESQPTLTADGNEMFFASNRGGSSDIYRCVRFNGVWSRPEKLPVGINTSGDEMAPFIYHDGRTLYFSSNKLTGMGGADLFLVRRNPDGTWQKPVNLGYPINTKEDEINFIVAADGMTAFISSQREEGYGHYDIYSFELDESIRSESVTYVDAIVFDKKTGKPLIAKANFFDPENGELLYSYKSGGDGKFFAVLPSRKSYSVEVTSDNYLFYQASVSPEGSSELTPFDMRVPLESMGIGNSVSLQNIHFEFGSAVLSPSSKAGINMIANFLNDNPDVVVELAGHTDNVGDAEFNQNLSVDRANVVRNVLISKGISPERMQAAGYGDTRPLVPNDTDENRALNRRTEMKILNM